MVYKGMMLSGVPNFAFAVGYTNASWTLKADLVGEYVCRLLAHMDAARLPTPSCPVDDDPRASACRCSTSRPATSSARSTCSRTGRLARAVAAGMSYARRRAKLRRGALDDGALRFTRRPAAAAAPATGELQVAA